MNSTNTGAPKLNNWLSEVRGFIDQRRVERVAMPKPKRNRERERARREARQLFREYQAECITLQ
jgi:hypothetical protein